MAHIDTVVIYKVSSFSLLSCSELVDKFAIAPVLIQHAASINRKYGAILHVFAGYCWRL